MSDKKESTEELRLMALELEQYESGFGGKNYISDDFEDRSKIKVIKAKRENIFKLKAADYDNLTIASELGLREIEVEVILERDKNKMSTYPNCDAIIEMYKDGHTLDVIGQKYKLTRERIRQIIKREVGNQLGYGPMEQQFRQAEISTAVRALVEISREDRLGDIAEKKIAAAEKKGIQAKYFDSVSKYCMAVGVSQDTFKKSCPELYQLVKRNENIKKSRWNQYYDACVMCGTTNFKYRSTGYCENCYPKSEHFKSLVQRSNQKNRESRLARNKVYSEDYYTRPEVIKRLEEEYDEKYFGGNRKKALERDGYKCISCGMTTDIKYSSGKPKVRVWHLDGTEHNRLENLGTYDQSCFLKKYGSNGRFKLK